MVYKGHFRQGSKEQGPMKSNIFIGQEFKIGLKVFSKLGQGPRQIKLWFSLHGIILEGKPWFGPIKKNLKDRSWFGEPKCKLGSKVGHFYCFLLSLLFKLCENGRHDMDWGHCWEHTNSPIFDQF
jgi:hypothetical protein